MHQSVKPNYTDVVFGVLSDPMNGSINPVSLSVLRSSLIELFLKQSNLTLTQSIFGNASIFEILKFPGGLTVIPLQSAYIWQMPEVLFNFTLNNSIYEVLEYFDDFKDELKFGLHLFSDEVLSPNLIYLLFLRVSTLFRISLRPDLNLMTKRYCHDFFSLNCMLGPFTMSYGSFFPSISFCLNLVLNCSTVTIKFFGQYYTYLNYQILIFFSKFT